MKKKVSKKIYPERAKDVPVTQNMLFLVRDELKADTKSLEHKLFLVRDDLKHNVKSLEGKIGQVRSELKADIKSLEHKMNSKFENLSSQIHSIKILVEEQNAKNNIVLDGLSSLFHRQDRVEKLVSGNN